MSVEEIISEIRKLEPTDRRRVRAVLDELAVEADPADEAGRRLEDVLALLDEGWCDGGGRALSEGIDEALYRGDA